MHDFRTKARRGALAATMDPIVERLTNADLVDIAAYLASVKPTDPPVLVGAVPAAPR
jgi:cytochrome c553